MPAPAGYVIAGEAASLPAVNSLLESIGDGVASNNRTTRAVAEVLREDYRIAKTSITARAYWAEGA